MFPSSRRTSTLTQRALGALRLIRSFLLLEDDHDVDWEVGQDERTSAAHPHRAPLRGRRIPRRQGESPPRTQACVSPVARPAHPTSTARPRDSSLPGRRLRNQVDG